MDVRSVCIIGGSGFVGRSIAETACGRGLRVRVVTRSAPRARRLLVLPTLEVTVADPNDPKALERALEDMDVAINLVGILHESARSTFQSAHVELPRKLAMAARSAGVRQLIHMSALGASASGPSEYLRTKALGEAAVREACADLLPHVIFRPSVIFGEHDRFLNFFAELLRFSPFFPLGGAQARFQPIWVEDVARAFVAAIGDVRTFGEAFELCGPRVYTLAELVRLVASLTERHRPVIELPPALAEIQALLLELVPGKPMTRDNLRSMQVDNVCSGASVRAFGFDPSPLEVVVPQYLARAGLRERYNIYRHHAGR